MEIHFLRNDKATPDKMLKKEATYFTAACPILTYSTDTVHDGTVCILPSQPSFSHLGDVNVKFLFGKLHLCTACLTVNYVLMDDKMIYRFINIMEANLNTSKYKQHASCQCTVKVYMKNE